ncbi:IclR family transcriptional regulator [Enemella sp. A6]|uniref:IclR family transcriptional regulator n=1 Tax=Enemella sp. A6 TaxID=3440152 RepID=UPI003EB84B26
MDEQAKSSPLLSLRILEQVVSRSGDWGVSEMATELNITKGRAHRHLTGLRDAGYLAQSSDTRRYSAGWRLLMLAQRAVTHSDLVATARPVMEELRGRVQQTVVLSELTAMAVTPVVVLAGGSPIDVVMLPGTRFGYNSSAQGKVALAFANEEQKMLWGRQISERRTDKTIMDPEALWREVAQVRQRGWAGAPDETFDGINAVAAPVFSFDGTIRATLAIVAATHFLPAEPPRAFVESLLEAADQVSKLLGYQAATAELSNEI